MDTPVSPEEQVIIILGPTAVGKTGFSLLLAGNLETEIISADSMLVYRHMDIGTAKPSRDELGAVPHHLINILDPDERFSAGMFKKMASEVINGLHGRGKIPVIAGGTGLYIRALTKGLFEGPGADEELRSRLIREEEMYGHGYLYETLKSMDPDAASSIEKQDRRRIIRALEVSMNGQRAMSDAQRESTQPLSCTFVKIGLTRDRGELYRMIDERVDAMMEQGLLGETERLLGMHPDRTALQALGYKEMASYLRGEQHLDDAVALIKRRTRNFAKRQYTWFRKEEGVHWVDVTGLLSSREIFTKVLNDVTILRNFLSQ